MQPPLVLRGETTASRHLLHLLLAIPEQSDASADRTAVAGGSFQFELDPLVLLRHRVLVDQQWPLLVSDHNVEDTAVPQVGKRDCTAVVSISDSHRLGHIDKFSRAVVHPDSFRLETGKTAAFKRWPVFCIADD